MKKPLYRFKLCYVFAGISIHTAEIDAIDLNEAKRKLRKSVKGPVTGIQRENQTLIS